MTARSLILALTATLGVALPAVAKDDRVYELRRYYPVPDQFEAMTALVKDHGVPAFKRHGIVLEAAMVPPKADNGPLVVLYSFPSAEARKTSWEAFRADPAWVKAKDAAKAVAKFDSQLLATTDYSPNLTDLDARNPGRIFELRTYTATPNNLPNLNRRFKNHTVKLFEKYGMTNVIYFNLLKGEPHADVTLVYLLSHASDAARVKSFDEFRNDPDWKAALAASEKAGGGSLTKKPDGVQSLVLVPLAWSPLK